MELWDEMIEVATYGPSERKMLKAQRQQEQELTETTTTAARRRSLSSSDSDAEWTEAFASVKSAKEDEAASSTLEYDGYRLRDLLVERWGAPLDVDFQNPVSPQGGALAVLYCTVLPMVGYGGGRLKSRHESELDYLCHLQGIVETLHKYDNLDTFLLFVKTTNKKPKPGTDSVPYRMDLSKDDLDKILKNRSGYYGGGL